MEQIARDKDDGTTPLSEEDKTRLIEEVKKVMEYCTNISRCRRVQVLRYFNEVFDARDCHRGCDVCMDDGEVTTWDVSTAAIDAVNLVKSMIGNNSMTHCKAVFVGSKKREVVQRGHNELLGHGKGTGLGQKAVDQLFEELVAIDAFREQPISNAAGWSNNYLQVSSALPLGMSANYTFLSLAWAESRRGTEGKEKGNDLRQGRSDFRASIQEDHEKDSLETGCPCEE